MRFFKHTEFMKNNLTVMSLVQLKEEKGLLVLKLLKNVY